MSIGISILSWRAAETLTASLESYTKADLFSHFDEAQVFLPDPDTKVLAAAKPFPVQIRTSPENLGIMENMARAAQAMSCVYILMLENDCPLIQDSSEVEAQISKALDLMQNKNVIMTRFRSVSDPGQAFPGLAKYRRLFDGSRRSRLTRRFRPDKVKRLTGYALYDMQSSIDRHRDFFEYVDNDFYLVEASVMPWTNQSILVHRKTFLDKILPLARAETTRRGANQLPNLEIELNRSQAWRNSGWKIACGPGLFTHERIGGRGYV